MKMIGSLLLVSFSLLFGVAFAQAGGYASGNKGVALEPPTALKLGIVKNTFQLSWKISPQDPGNVMGYEIFRSTNLASGPFTKVATVGKGVSQYTDRTAGPEIIYYYKVRAVAGSSKSPYSNTVTGER